MGTGPPVVLDGALGTEIERRGVRSGLPLWSTHALLTAPAVVREIHFAYAEAGAEVLTAASFRTQRRTLEAAGLPGAARRAAELTRLSVELAREGAAAAKRPPFVVGSAPPLEDCFRPERVPDRGECESEHREHADNLAAAGVDGIAIETMNDAGEAALAAAAAAATGLPFWVSFVCRDDARLLSGEPLDLAISRVREVGASWVGVNCVPPSTVSACLPGLAASGLDFCVYANLFAPHPGPRSASKVQGTSPPDRDASPSTFAEHARSWLAAGARMLGGCCGTGPEHVRALGEVVLEHAALEQ